MSRKPWQPAGDGEPRKEHLREPLPPLEDLPIINSRCQALPVAPIVWDTVRPSPKVDRFIRDISHEWREQAWNKAVAIDAGPPRKR